MLESRKKIFLWNLQFVVIVENLLFDGGLFWNTACSWRKKWSEPTFIFSFPFSTDFVNKSLFVVCSFVVLFCYFCCCCCCCFGVNTCLLCSFSWTMILSFQDLFWDAHSLDADELNENYFVSVTLFVARWNFTKPQ